MEKNTKLEAITKALGGEIKTNNNLCRKLKIGWYDTDCVNSNIVKYQDFTKEDLGSAMILGIIITRMLCTATRVASPLESNLTKHQKTGVDLFAKIIKKLPKDTLTEYDRGNIEKALEVRDGALYNYTLGVIIATSAYWRESLREAVSAVKKDFPILSWDSVTQAIDFAIVDILKSGEPVQKTSKWVSNILNREIDVLKNIKYEVSKTPLAATLILSRYLDNGHEPRKRPWFAIV